MLSLDFAPIDECKGFTCHPILTVLIYRKIPVIGVVICYVLKESLDYEQCHLQGDVRRGSEKEEKRKKKHSRKKKDLIELRGTLGGLNSLDSRDGPAEKEGLLVV